MSQGGKTRNRTHLASRSLGT